MSIKILSIVKRHRVGSASAKAVLLEMADHAAPDGSGVAVPKTHIAAVLEMGRRTVQEAVTRLSQAGLITETGKRPYDRGYTVVYRINVKEIEALPLAREDGWQE